MFPLTTTLNHIADCNPCDYSWQAGLQAANKTEPDDEPISYEAILDAVGLHDALWCCQAEPQHAGMWRRFAVWCARHVQHLMADERSIRALDVAERHANGDATDSELAAARAAARAAAWAAATATAAAAWAAASAAADDATCPAAWAAAVAAADAAVAAADAAAAADAGADAAVAATAFYTAGRAATPSSAAAAKAAKAAQSAAFRQLVTTGTLPALAQRLEVAA